MDPLTAALLAAVSLLLGFGLGFAFGRREGATVNLTVATNQEVTPPDPWKDVVVDDDDDGEGWKRGESPLGPAG